MATIFETRVQYRALQQFIEEGNQDGFELALSQIEDSLAEKLEGYASVKANIESDIDGLDKEIKRLQARKSQMSKDVERLKSVMHETLLEVPGNKLKGNYFTFSLRSSSSVEVEDMSKIPLGLLIPQEPKPDKISIKAHIKSGINVPGASIKTKQSLSIR